MPGTPPKYNLPVSSFKNYKRPEAKDSILKKQFGEEYNVNPSARVYPYSYTPKLNKYGFLQKIKIPEPNLPSLLVGGIGAEFPRKGINANIAGSSFLTNDPNLKGVGVGGTVSKKFGKLNAGLEISKRPQIHLKYNFEKGGPLNSKNNTQPPYNTSGPKTSNKESQEEKDAMNAMMKAKLAYAYIHGNPAAKRMVAPVDNPYDFGDGYLGTHYMGSYNFEDESGKERYYAIPNIQDVDGTLKMTGPRANEEIEFDRPEDARYFAENYKRISPMFINNKMQQFLAGYNPQQMYQNGGALAPIIPTYYKSKRTPIYRDTTDAPPKIFEGGGRMTKEELLKYIDNNPNKIIQEVNLPETTVYGDQEKKKLQGNLFQKLDQLKRATKKYYNDRGFGKIFLKQDPTSEVGAMQQNINQYKTNLEDEKRRYVKAESALKNLKKYMPDQWEDKKLKDVFSTKGYNNLRKLYKEGNISQGTFMNFYKNFAGEYDPLMSKGKGKGAVYDAQEARRVWGKDWDEFTSMINKFALAAPMVGAAGAFAGPINAGLASTARGIGAGWGALSQPIIGSTNALGMYSGAAPGLAWLTPSLGLEGYGAYYLADQLGDENSRMRKSWKNVSENTNLSTIDEAVGATGLPFLGASGTMLKTAGTVIPKIIGGAKTVANIPQIRTLGTGLKEVGLKPNRWNELLKQKSVYRFEKPKTTSLRSNVKADPTRDVTRGKWYQDKSNPEFNLYSNPTVNPNARRFTGSEASLSKYNLKNLQAAQRAGKPITDAQKVAVERSIGSIKDPQMHHYINEVKLKFGEARAKQIEELVSNPNNYWDFKTFKGDAVNRLLLRNAPVNKTEYLLPNKFAFDPVRKTSELRNISPQDKFNYFKNLGSEYKVGATTIESKLAPKIAKLAKPAGTVSKSSKMVSSIEEEEEKNKITTNIP